MENDTFTLEKEQVRLEETLLNINYLEGKKLGLIKKMQAEYKQYLKDYNKVVNALNYELAIKNQIEKNIKRINELKEFLLDLPDLEEDF